MDLSQFPVMEQSPFHSWCCPKRRARALPFTPTAVSFSRQSSKPRMCCLISPPCQPRSGMVASQGEEPPLPQPLFPACLSWHRRAGQQAELPHHLLTASPLHCPHHCRRNHTTCTKPKAFHAAICSFLPPRPLLANKTPVFEGRDNGAVQLTLRRRAGNGATAELSPSSPLLRPSILLFWFSDIYLSLNAQFLIQHICFTKRLVTTCKAVILWSENTDNPRLPSSLHWLHIQ